MSRDPVLHSWDLNTAEARDLQLELAARVDSNRPLAPYQTVAGADVSYNKYSPSGSTPRWWCSVRNPGGDRSRGHSGRGRISLRSGPPELSEAPAVIEAFRSSRSGPTC